MALGERHPSGMKSHRTSFSRRRLGALIRKEGIQILRDPSSILIAFILPAVLLFLFGYAVSLDSTQVRIGVAMEERTPESESFVTALRNSRYFQVNVGFARRPLEDDLVAGRARGLVIIPADFSRQLARPDGTAVVQVIADGSEPNTASFVQNYVRAAVSVWQSERGLEHGAKFQPLVRIEDRMWFNASLESKNYLVPGSIAIVMTLIGTMLTALVVAREWERGTMEAMMATPVGIGELVLGKLIPYFCLGFGSMAFCTAVSVFVFGTPMRGSFVSLAGLTAAFLLACLGLGLLVSTLAKSQFIAGQIALILGFLPAFQLSGFIFEISSMPRIIRGITFAFPARYFVQGLHTVFLAGDVPAILLRDGAALCGFAALFFGLTARITRKKLA